MVIDTSALVAILQKEPERRMFIEAIEAADPRLMSVATFVEISIVIEVIIIFVKRSILVTVKEIQPYAAGIAGLSDLCAEGVSVHRVKLNDVSWVHHSQFCNHTIAETKIGTETGVIEWTP